MSNSESEQLGMSDRVFGVVIGLSVLPLLFLFAILGNAALGRAAALSTAVILVVIRLTWDLRKHHWFWATLICIVGLHIVVLGLVRWSEKSYPGFALVPVGIADFCLAYGLIKVVEKLVQQLLNRR